MKGIIFTIDVFFSVVIVMGIIFLAVFSMLRAGDPTWTKLRLEQMGNDFLFIADYNQTLDEFDKGVFNDFYNVMMPLNLNMTVNASCWTSDGTTRVTWSGEDEFEYRKVELEEFVSGRKVFVTDDFKYCYADYRIWYS